MPRQSLFAPPQRATSMGVADGGGTDTSSGLSSMDSPYAARLPLRAPGSSQPSYTGKNGTVPRGGFPTPVNTSGGFPMSSNAGGFASSKKAMATPEMIRPSPGNPSRQSEPQTAMFNLLATIVGGGVLSLPYAMSLTGVVTGVLLIAVAAVGGDFSLYMLCSCARRTGTVTYPEVAQAAFGPAGGHLTVSILAILTLFVIVAYMVLVRDIWSGLVEAVLGEDLSPDQCNQVLFVALVLVFPMCLAKDLHALRHFCYVGFFSVMVLTAAIGYRCFEEHSNNSGSQVQIKLTADSWSDIFEACPILCLSFMCHFNILSVHSKFVQPTRERLRGLLHGTMGSAAVIYITISLCGYLYAYGNTKDDILLNFDAGDTVIVFGRLGMGATMLVAITLMILPCRDIMFTLIERIGSSIKGCTGQKEYLPVEDMAQATPGGTPVTGVSAFLQGVQHVGMTIAIFAVCLFFALAVPGVGVVWSICGSSVGFVICYLLPATMYLKIRAHKKFNIRKAGAWFIVVFSSLAVVICTRNALKNALK